MSVGIKQLGPDVWEQRFVTAAHPVRVFDYIADFARHVDWERELVAVKPLNKKTGAGAKYLKTYGARPRGPVARFFSRGLRATCTVKEIDRPHRIRWKQHRSHQASEPSAFQTVELEVSPRGSGSMVVLTRRFVGLEASSIELVARYSSGLGQALQGLPPGIRAAATGSSGAPSGMFSTPADAVRYALDGYPSGGPGPTSLERLKAILDAK